jgi:hypothetical protein
MSTVMMRREIPPVCFDAVECGIEFSETTSDVQAEFLATIGLRVTDEEYSDWPMQCRFIVDEMTEADRGRVASAMRTLLEHLEEVR